MVQVDSDILKDNPEQPLIDPNIGPVKMTVSGNRLLKIHTKPTIELKEPCQVKYHWLYYRGSDPIIIITGQVPKGKKYEVAIDSGFAFSVILSDKIILENNLPIYPIEHEQVVGICYLPFLQLGKATIRNVPGFWMKQQWELQLFGIPIWREKWVIVGLGIMKDFRYILLDGLRREVELSAEQSFAPAEPDNWSQYTFTIEKDRTNNDRLRVDIPIEDEKLHIRFDTCCPYSLAVSSKLWAKLFEKVKAEDARDSKCWSWQDGFTPCQKILIPKLTVGNRVISNAEVLVLPEDNTDKPWGFIGMGCFKNTVVVLDFERNLMWVKNDAR